MLRLTQAEHDAIVDRVKMGRPLGSKDKRKRRPGTGLYQREATIQKAIIAYLNLHPNVAWCVRLNSGVMTIEGRLFKASFRGCSDIIGQLKDGRFLAVEVKRPNRKPTDDQAAFLHKVSSNGGVALVASSIDDVERNIGSASDAPRPR